MNLPRYKDRAGFPSQGEGRSVRAERARLRGLRGSGAVSRRKWEDGMDEGSKKQEMREGGWRRG
jgi:hypothetical protein